MVLLIHTVAYFSPLHNLDLPFVSRNGDQKASARSLSQSYFLCPHSFLPLFGRGGGTERATGGSERCCLWLMLRVAALADWGQTGKGKGFLLYPALPGTPHGLREPHGSPHPSAPCTCLMADLWSQGARPLCGSGLCLP